MATIDTVISNARYDLRDTDSTLYTDAELRVYANRALRQLDNVLSARNSDWVLNETTLTLSTGDNYADCPGSCIVVRDAWISSDHLVKKSPAGVYKERKYISSTGQPFYFAEKGTQLIVEREADDDYTLTAYYDKRATTLVEGADMPYNDEFNAPIREMIITLAHKRNEADVYTDTYIYNFFWDWVSGNVLRRSHVPRRTKLDF